jgi:hypothetical protein
MSRRALVRLDAAETVMSAAWAVRPKQAAAMAAQKRDVLGVMWRSQGSPKCQSIHNEKQRLFRLFAVFFSEAAGPARFNPNDVYGEMLQ